MIPLIASADASGVLYQGMLIGALASILPLFFSCYAFFGKFATKSEVKEIEERSDKRYRENQERVEKLETRLVADLGRIEGRLTREVTQNRADNEKHTGELGVRLENLTNAIQLFVNETNRATGQSEGK